MEEGKSIHVATLTAHFAMRWFAWLGSAPSVEAVNSAIRNSQCIKRGQDLLERINGRLCPHRTLTEIWNHHLGIIIWLDERSGKAVTVIAPQEPLDDNVGCIPMNHRELIHSAEKKRKFRFMRLPNWLQDEIISGLETNSLTFEKASILAKQKGYQVSHGAISDYCSEVRRLARSVIHQALVDKNVPGRQLMKSEGPLAVSKHTP